MWVASTTGAIQRDQYLSTSRLITKIGVSKIGIALRSWNFYLIHEHYFEV